MQAAIIGAGGIGSYLSRGVSTLQKVDQFDSNMVITIIDDDEVVEKNVLYQDFENNDIFEMKAEIIGKRYKWPFEVKRIKTVEDLKRYNLIIAAVDNSETRKLVYEWGELKDSNYWIDLRAESRAVCFYTKHEKNTMKTMLATLKGAEGTSCQLPFELEKKIIQNGNKIIAEIGAQLILNYTRNIPNPASFNRIF